MMAFEVAWGDVVGMDYASRLMEDTRLVLEARSVAKRVFASVRPAGVEGGAARARAAADARADAQRRAAGVRRRRQSPFPAGCKER